MQITVSGVDVQVNKKISATGFKNYICLKETSDIDVDRYGNKCPFCDEKLSADT